MRTFLVFICLSYHSLICAQDFGVWGKTFVIHEMDFLEYIQQKIAVMQRTGEWKKTEIEFKKRVKEHLIRPKPTFLTRAKKDKSWFFNPSITVPYDVKNLIGEILVKQGTVINPLERVSLRSPLIFFDGDDKEQVEWVSQKLKQKQPLKLILTSGSVKEVTHHFKQAIYFDLNGFLIAKFHIKHVPAEVMQAGQSLVIREVSL